MRSRLSRYAPALLVVLVAQGLAVLVYVRVERYRTKSREAAFRYERLAPPRSAPDLVLSSPDGSTRTLSDLRGKTVLLHFWATWCPPCREELPGLLTLGRELSQDGSFRVVAVTLDRDWDTVRNFFGGDVPNEVVQDKSSRSVGAYNLSELPDTYLVTPDGALRLRFNGARNWRNETAREVVSRYRKPQ